MKNSLGDSRGNMKMKDKVTMRAILPLLDKERKNCTFRAGINGKESYGLSW